MARILAILIASALVPLVSWAQAEEPAAGASQPPPQSSDSQYIIGPGDMLQIFVWRNPELSVSIPVLPDGKISMPLVDNMEAVGKTPSKLAQDIEAVLGEYVRSPRVNVIVTQPVSRFSQVKAVGQVQKPQSLAFREGMTVLDVVLESGGLTPYAAGNRAKLIRTENGKETEFRVKLADLLNKGDMAQNLAVRPGDVLVIPESYF